MNDKSRGPVDMYDRLYEYRINGLRRHLGEHQAIVDAVKQLIIDKDPRVEWVELGRVEHFLSVDHVSAAEDANYLWVSVTVSDTFMTYGEVTDNATAYVPMSAVLEQMGFPE